MNEEQAYLLNPFLVSACPDCQLITILKQNKEKKKEKEGLMRSTEVRMVTVGPFSLPLLPSFPQPAFLFVLLPCLVRV